MWGFGPSETMPSCEEDPASQNTFLGTQLIAVARGSLLNYDEEANSITVKSSKFGMLLYDLHQALGLQCLPSETGQLAQTIMTSSWFKDKYGQLPQSPIDLPIEIVRELADDAAYIGATIPLCFFTTWDSLVEDMVNTIKTRKMKPPRRKDSTSSVLSDDSNATQLSAASLCSGPISRRKYGELSKVDVQQLVAMIKEKDLQIEALRKSKQNCNRVRVCRLKSKLASRRAQKKLIAATSYTKTNGRKKNRHHFKFTVFGGISIALMKIAIGAGAWRCSLACGVDVHGSTVCRWEKKTADAMLAYTKSWHAGQESLMKEQVYHHRMQPINFGVHQIRSDATHGQIIHEDKLQISVCRSAYTNFSYDVALDTFEAHTEEHEHYADLIKVRGQSGGHTHAHLLKCMECLGVPTWMDEKSKIASDPTLLDAKVDFIRTYVITSDAGSDIASAQRMAEVACQEIPWVLILTNFCLLHQLHLLVRKLLEATSIVYQCFSTNHEQTYWSSVATVLHAWRESSATILAEWDRDDPSKVSKDTIRKVPPRPITGRWGSFHRCLDHLLKVNRHTLIQCMSIIFSAVKKQTKSASQRCQIGGDDDENYHDRVTKWRRLCLAHMQDDGWYFLNQVVQRAQAIIVHMFHYFEKELLEGTIMNLVWTKHKEFTNTFESMLTLQYWEHILSECPDGISFSLVHWSILWFTTHAYCDYSRRIGRKVESYPWKLFLLCRGPPDTPSESNRMLAQDFVDFIDKQDAEDMDATLTKIAIIFENALAAACKDGCVQVHFHSWLYTSGRLLHGNSQAVEGAANMLVHETKKNGHVCADTVSARLQLRKALMTSTTFKKASAMKPVMDKLRSQSMQGMSQVHLHPSLASEAKWATPEPVTIKTGSHYGSKEEAARWAAPYHKLWKANYKVGFKQLWTIKLENQGSVMGYVCPLTHGLIGQMLQVDVTANFENKNGFIELLCPMHTIDSLTMLTNIHSAITEAFDVGHLHVWNISWANSPDEWLGGYVSNPEELCVMDEAVAFSEKPNKKHKGHNQRRKPATEADKADALKLLTDQHDFAADEVDPTNEENADDERIMLKCIDAQLGKLSGKEADTAASIATGSEDKPEDVQDAIAQALLIDIEPPKCLVNSEDVAKAFGQWTKSYLLSVGALKSGHEQNQNKDLLHGSLGHLSIIKVESEIVIVNWLSTSSWIGQPVYLDEEFKIIYSMPFLHPYRDYSDSHMLMKSAFCRMRKVRKGMRDPFPELALRLLQLWQTQQTIQVDGGNSVDNCCICNSNRSDADVKTCGMCLMSAHDTCQALMIPMYNKWKKNTERPSQV